MVCKKAAERAGRRLRQEADRHRPVHVRRVPAAAVREARRQQELTSAARRRSTTITYRYIPSDATRDLAFQIRRARHGVRPPDRPVGRAHGCARCRASRSSSIEPAELNMLHLNIKAKPLDDIRVRQAIAHAVDRKGMVQFAGRAGRARGDQRDPERQSRHRRRCRCRPTTSPRPRQLLAEAGYPNGLTIKVIVSRRMPTLSKHHRGAAGAAAQGRHHARHRSRSTTRPITQQIRKDLSPIVLYQAARFPVADVLPDAVLPLALDRRHADRASPTSPTAMWPTRRSRPRAPSRTRPSRRRCGRRRRRRSPQALCGVPFSESLQVWAWSDALDLGYEMAGSLNLMPHLTEKTRFVR